MIELKTRLVQGHMTTFIFRVMFANFVFLWELRNDYTREERKNIKFQIRVEVCHTHLKTTNETHGVLFAQNNHVYYLT